MINIVLMGHGDFPAGIQNAARMIMGEQERFYIVSLQPEDSPESFTERVDDVLNKVGEDAEVLFAVDLKGGTPSNVAARYVTSQRRCVTGVNLPMVLELFMSRSIASSAKELAMTAVEAGSTGVVDFSSEIDAMKGICK